jgi:hypothetical protein
VFLLCFSAEESGTQRPWRVSKKELHDAFAPDWSTESIEPSATRSGLNLKDINFSEGGPKAWFVGCEGRALDDKRGRLSRLGRMAYLM